MQLKDQLCTLPQARRLDELGFKGESLYSYVDTRKSRKAYNCPPVDQYVDPVFVPFWGLDQASRDLEIRLSSQGGDNDNNATPLAAYSAVELMDALPDGVHVFKEDKRYYVTNPEATHRTTSANLAEALADMRIRLITEGLYIVNKE